MEEMGFCVCLFLGWETIKSSEADTERTEGKGRKQFELDGDQKIAIGGRNQWRRVGGRVGGFVAGVET